MLTVDVIQSLINTNFILMDRRFRHLFNSKQYEPTAITNNIFTLLIAACANTPDDPLQLALDLQEIIDRAILIPQRAAEQAAQNDRRARAIHVMLRGHGYIPTAEINDAQSTHAVSIHASISQTALRLKNHYIQEMSPEGLIKAHKEILVWLTALEKTFHNTAALNGYHHCSLINYTDKVSDVSIRELVALFWVAIHDDTKRIGTLDDAKKFFITAFYEIRRGYNINKAGVDDGGPDRSICTGGTFNKLINQLQGIHSLVIVKVINQSLANYKFKALIVTAAIEFFKKCDSSTSSSSGVSKKDRVFDAIMLENAGIEAIWNDVKEDVINTFYEEFGSLY